jgi:hypothetical protein
MALDAMMGNFIESAARSGIGFAFRVDLCQPRCVGDILTQMSRELLLTGKSAAADSIVWATIWQQP